MAAAATPPADRVGAMDKPGDAAVLVLRRSRLTPLLTTVFVLGLTSSVIWAPSRAGWPLDRVILVTAIFVLIAYIGLLATIWPGRLTLSREGLELVEWGSRSLWPWNMVERLELSQDGVTVIGPNGWALSLGKGFLTTDELVQALKAAHARWSKRRPPLQASVRPPPPPPQGLVRPSGRQVLSRLISLGLCGASLGLGFDAATGSQWPVTAAHVMMRFFHPSPFQHGEVLLEIGSFVAGIALLFGPGRARAQEGVGLVGAAMVLLSVLTDLSAFFLAGFNAFMLGLVTLRPTVQQWEAFKAVLHVGGEIIAYGVTLAFAGFVVMLIAHGPISRSRRRPAGPGD
jgi:hypothetical protein